MFNIIPTPYPKPVIFVIVSSPTVFFHPIFKPYYSGVRPSVQISYSEKDKQEGRERVRVE